MSKATILVVDDVELNLMIIEEILKDEYDVVLVSSGLQAIDLLFNAVVTPKIILLDIMMPEMDGYEVLEIIKSNESLSKIPVIFITASGSEFEGLSAGAVDYISKPFTPEIVRLRVANHIKLKNYSDSLEEMVAEKVHEITETRDKMLDTMANIIEYRNLESGGHVKRTTEYTAVLIDYMLKNSEYADEISKSAPETIKKSVSLHDIGKIGIQDEVLLKPGKLTFDEFEIMKTHTTIGKDIVESLLQNQDAMYLKHCRDIAYFHHERFDGKGYPLGISGKDIPISARILSIIDVYDALVSKRIYKRAFTHEESLDIIKEGSGTQFDPVIVNAMLEIEDVFYKISQVEYIH